jgi:hypothetical protein
MSTTSSETTAVTRKPPLDTRGFWRILLAVIAPLPMLTNAICYLLSPTDGNAPFEENVTATWAGVL